MKKVQRNHHYAYWTEESINTQVLIALHNARPRQPLYGWMRPDASTIREPDFARELTKMIARSKEEGELVVSVDHADWVQRWIRNIFDIKKIREKITGVTILRITETMFSELLRLGMIRQEFIRSLEDNLKTMRDAVSGRYGCPFTIKEWKSFPLWHGYVFENEAFVNKWSLNSNGIVHVATDLKFYRRGSVEFDSLSKDEYFVKAP
ncbi:MAG: hypothetical protein LIQ31_15655 [Planctomycetes bacterium]|nr:hypothetical protein [Planctomycetota bacterium]